MTILSEPFSDNIAIWVLIFWIITIGGIIGYILIAPLPETDYHKVLNSLDCKDLKEWIKYNLNSPTAKTMYIEKCIK